MTVTSTCQYSLGLVARTPSFGVGGWTRARGRSQPLSRMSRPQVAGDAKSIPMRWAWSARPRNDMWAIAAAGREVVHGADFLGRKLRRRRSRAGAAVIKLAGALDPIPGVVPRRRKAENAQHHCELQSRPRSGDCGQDLGFCGAVWNAGLVQAHSGEAEQHEEGLPLVDERLRGRVEGVHFQDWRLAAEDQTSVAAAPQVAGRLTLAASQIQGAGQLDGAFVAGGVFAAVAVAASHEQRQS